MVKGLCSFNLFILFLLMSSESSADVTCVDAPHTWRDIQGCDCDAYTEAAACEAGQLGDAAANLTNFARGGMDAADVCCACGGGLTDPCAEKMANRQEHTSSSIPFGAELGLCMISTVTPVCDIDQCVQPKTGATKYRAVGAGTVTCAEKENGSGEMELRWTAENTRAKGDLQCLPCYDLIGWQDTDGFTCDDYYNLDLCWSEGQYGNGWTRDYVADSKLSTMSFQAYAVNGIDAATACCACGGGILQVHATCSSADPIPNGALLDATKCVALPYGQSCEYKCDPGYVKSRTHVCGLRQVITGGSCVSPNDLAASPTETPLMLPEDTNLAAQLAKFDNVPNWGQKALSYVTALGDPQMLTDVTILIHSGMYTLSWFSWGIFLVKAQMQMASYEQWAVITCCMTAGNPLVLMFASDMQECQDLKRLVVSFTWFPVTMMIWGRVRMTEEIYIEQVVDLNMDKLKRQEAQTKHDQDVEHSILHDVTPDVSSDELLPDAQQELSPDQADELPSAAVEDGADGPVAPGDDGVSSLLQVRVEDADNDSLGGNGRAAGTSAEEQHREALIKLFGNTEDDSLPYGIHPDEIRRPTQWGRYFYAIGIVLVAIVVITFFSICELAKMPDELTLGSRTGQSSTRSRHDASLAVSGRNFMKTRWSVQFCAETMVEKEPYWQVDLGKEYKLDQVWIRGGCEDDMDKSVYGEARVQLVRNNATRYSYCGGSFQFQDIRRMHILECKFAVARYVRVTFVDKGTPKRLCLCDVQVKELTRHMDTPIKKTRPAPRSGFECT